MNKTEPTEAALTINEAEFVGLLAQVQQHDRADVLSSLEAELKEHQGIKTA